MITRRVRIPLNDMLDIYVYGEKGLIVDKNKKLDEEVISKLTIARYAGLDFGPSWQTVQYISENWLKMRKNALLRILFYERV